jgi:hypothetical protein
MKVVYENSFDWNEWSVIISLVLLSLLVWITPKIFSMLEGMAYFVYGIFTGMFFDHTISVEPWDFYDVNDSSSYELMDFLSYIMYGPVSYFFVYLYVRLKIKGFMHIIYIPIWTGISLIIEWGGVGIGLFHFEKGFKMYWSIPIYLLTQSILIVFLNLVKKNKTIAKSQFEEDRF